MTNILHLCINHGSLKICSNGITTHFIMYSTMYKIDRKPPFNDQYHRLEMKQLENNIGW